MHNVAPTGHAGAASHTNCYVLAAAARSLPYATHDDSDCNRHVIAFRICQTIWSCHVYVGLFALKADGFWSGDTFTYVYAQATKWAASSWLSLALPLALAVLSSRTICFVATTRI